MMAAAGVAVAAWGAGGEGEVRVISLEEGMAMAMERNWSLQASALSAAAAAAAGERERARLGGVSVRPVGSVEGGSGTQRREAGMEGEWTAGTGFGVGVRATGREWELEDGSENRRGEIRVSASQPLFREFGRLMREESAVQAGEAERRAARTLAREKSATALAVAEAFEEIAYLRRQAECERRMAERMEKLAAIADLRERQGRAGRTEVLRMEYQRGAAESRLADVAARIDVRTAELGDLIGLEEGERFWPADPPALVLEEIGEAAALETAMRERPDVEQSREDAKTAERKVRIAKRSLWPDVRLTASKSFYGEGDDWGDAGALDEEEWTVGIGGSMDLNQREARMGVEQAEAERRRAEALATAKRRSVAQEVHTALAEERRARRELELAETNRRRAEERSELARALFEAGRGNADGVSDAEADALSAALAVHGARRQADVAAYRVLHAVGTLVPMGE